MLKLLFLLLFSTMLIPSVELSTSFDNAVITSIASTFGCYLCHVLADRIVAAVYFTVSFK